MNKRSISDSGAFRARSSRVIKLTQRYRVPKGVRLRAPTIFYVGLTSVFGNLTDQRGFDTDSYQSFLIAVSLLATVFTIGGRQCPASECRPPRESM